MVFKRTKLSLLVLSIYSTLGYTSELNLDFLHGINTVPSVLNTNSKFPAGQYYVDIILNKEKVGRGYLTINESDEKNNTLCLDSRWLKDSGIFFKESKYSNYFDKKNDCYQLGNEPNTKVRFDYSSQTLKFNVPQAYLINRTDKAFWDFGSNGARLKYYGNFNKSSKEDINSFGSFNLNANVGRWVLSNDVNASKSSGYSKVSTNSLTLSTALGELKGDLILGRSQTRSQMYSDFGYYGFALRSNRNMNSWDARGYAPVISGVANSQSRITVSQGGYTIYSKVVPAGPYQLDDVSPVSNGDIIVSVEDENGHKTSTVYPVATLPTLLRPSRLEYNFVLGKKNNNTEYKNVFSSNDSFFGLGSISYGFAFTTLNVATIIHNKYQSMGVGVTQSLGRIGAIESSVVTSRAHYDNNDTKSGNTFNIKYAKSFSDTTDLQLLTYRYQSKNYTEFADFDPCINLHINNAKSRYEARVSHRLDNSYLSASYWQQDYWQRNGYEKGATLSASTSYNRISLYLNGSYSRRVGNKDDYSMSLGISMPLDIGGSSTYSSSNIGYNRYSGSNFYTGVSATLNDRLNYNVSANVDSKGNRSGTGSLSYAFDAVQTNLSLSQNKKLTSLSGSLSGSAIVTGKSGLLLTKETANTIAIVNMSNLKGVKFNNSMPTNEHGETVVALNEYSPNSISVDMGNVPDDIELRKTSYEVVPTENAIIYRNFGYEHINRYILRVKNHQGSIINGGNAKTEQGLNAGFIANNGVLLMNMLAKPKVITVNTGNNSLCKFSMSSVKANINKVQEVYCE